MSQQTGPLYARQDYAGFIRRTLALALDLLLLLLVRSMAFWGWYCLAPPGWQTRRSDWWIRAGPIMAWWVYMVAFRLTTKGTLGYRITHIRYAYMLGEKPDALSILCRAVVGAALFRAFALDHLWIPCDRCKQAWHDKISGFYVVKAKAQPVGTVQVVRRVIHFMDWAFVVWEPIRDERPPPYARGLTVRSGP